MKRILFIAFLFLLGCSLGIAATTYNIKAEVLNGDFYINNKPSKIYLKEPDGTCCYLSVSNTEVLSVTTIACP